MRFCFPLVLLFAGIASAQQLRSLKAVAVPTPPNLNQYVRDEAALLALGKALFWDMQVGSDGRTACASCHFHAGADHRPQHQLSDPQNPFPLNLAATALSFPFRELADPGNRNSAVLRDTSMRYGSAGLVRRIFEDVVPGQAVELGYDGMDKPEFMIGDLQTRRVTSRNTPSVINSVFSVRSFWDGRAQRFFNGFTVTGNAADAPGVLETADGVLRRSAVRMDMSGLASQAVGPVLDHIEMSYEGRTWPKLGKKMMSLAPLALQRVSVNDSVLGALARAEERGLGEQHTYLGLIQAAFEPRFWESTQLVDAQGELLEGRFGALESTNEFTQAEYNFSLFWALSLQKYQATLVSDDTPFDRFIAGDRGALTAQEQEGLQLFQAGNRCTECHGGAEFSAASYTASGVNGRGNHAFDRTGVRPIAEDVGSGNGNFKSIGLRNVEFTGPYFHNGGTATLEQVVDFYRRGGDFNPTANDLRAFNANTGQRAALVAFLKALSDDRVRFQRAPFDHPELCVPSGHTEAGETWLGIPAVGADGLQIPLQTFDELLRDVGADGSRAHAMKEACAAPLP
ncbi:MAG: cytochrome C peroxidase [Bryobacterales bacterium]|nr:cytochrome C peroxidase [Bryobacterales bacterium]